MKKFLICLLAILIIIFSIHIYFKINISYEEYGYRVAYGIIKEKLDNETYEKLLTFINYEELSYFVNSFESNKYPLVELPERIDIPPLFDDNIYTIIETTYSSNYDSDGWTINPSMNYGGEFEYRAYLKIDNKSYPEVKVTLIIELDKRRKINDVQYYASVDILLNKVGFNNYNIKKINLKPLAENNTTTLYK